MEAAAATDQHAAGEGSCLPGAPRGHRAAGAAWQSPLHTCPSDVISGSGCWVRRQICRDSLCLEIVLRLFHLIHAIPDNLHLLQLFAD